jgi:3-oxoacyl-[acyl-carrier-protein] synthase II
MKQRVVVTGIGLVSPLGDSPAAMFEAVMAGRSAITLMTDPTMAPAAVAHAPFDAARWFTRLQLAGVDRVSQMAVAAGDLAREDAGLAGLGDDAGIYVGTGMGGAAAMEQAYVNLHGGRRIPPLSIPAFMANAPAAHLAMRLQVHGPVYTYSMACASAAVAIAEAAKAIARGELACALAGGSEALLVPGVIGAWQSLQTLAAPGDDPARACRPFSTDRSGLILGEGAAFLLLESLPAAQARGARIYAELAGSGFSCDAGHLTRPDAGGQARALRAALRDAELAPREVGYCNAHGTATQAGDVVECNALRAVWSDEIDALQVSSTKALHGHLLGAAGALEAAVTIMALHEQALPPNMHCDTQDAACDVTLVEPGVGLASALNAAISNTFAFGGSNMVLAFRRAA